MGCIWPIRSGTGEAWHTHLAAQATGKRKPFSWVREEAQPFAKRSVNMFVFLICTAIVTGCLIFLLWVYMEVNYSFISVELTLVSTHRGFVCLHYLDIRHTSARGAWSGVQALQTADFQVNCKIISNWLSSR